MSRRRILNLSAIAALGLAMLPGNALAQTKSLKDQLVGTWIIVSNDATAPDGKNSTRTSTRNLGPLPEG